LDFCIVPTPPLAAMPTILILVWPSASVMVVICCLGAGPDWNFDFAHRLPSLADRRRDPRSLEPIIKVKCQHRLAMLIKGKTVRESGAFHPPIGASMNRLLFP
jgi:hypothetical protein